MSTSNKKHRFVDNLVFLWPGLPYLGLGAWLAWIWLTTSGICWLSDFEIDGRNISSMYLLSTGISALVLLLLPFVYRFVERLLARSAYIYCSALIVSLGSLFILLAGPHFLWIRWFFYFGVVLTGIGVVLITLKCGQLYSSLTSKKIVVYVVLSQVALAFIYFFMLGFAWFRPVAGGPSLVGIILMLGLPLLAALLITRPVIQPASDNSLSVDNLSEFETRSSSSNSAVTHPHAVRVSISTPMSTLSGSFWKLCVTILFFTILTSVVRGLVIQSVAPSTTLRNNSMQMLLLLAFAGIFMFFMLQIAKKDSFGKIYVFFLVGTSIILILVSSLQLYFGVYATLFGFGLNIFEMIHWCLFAFIARQQKTSSIIVFGFGRGIFLAGCVIGWMLGAWVIPLISDPPLVSLIFVLLAALVLVCAIVIFSEKDFDHLFSAVFKKELDFAAPTTREEGTSISPEMGGGGGSSPPFSLPGQGTGQNFKQNVGQNLGRDLGQNLGRDTGDRDIEVLRSEALRKQDADEVLHARPYIEACKRVGAAAHLTEREQAVFEMLACGRDYPVIAKRLNLSVNTIRTYLNRAYIKLGVHSRQEVVALVNAERKRND